MMKYFMSVVVKSETGYSKFFECVFDNYVLYFNRNFNNKRGWLIRNYIPYHHIGKSVQVD